MKLRAIKIGDVIYYCNEKQIADAGGLEEAAKKMHDEANPPLKKMKPKQAMAEELKEDEAKSL